MRTKFYMRSVFEAPRDVDINSTAPKYFQDNPSDQKYEVSFGRTNYLFRKIPVGAALQKAEVTDDFSKAREQIMTYKGDEKDVIQGAFTSLYYARMLANSSPNVKLSVTEKEIIELNKHEQRLKRAFAKEYGEKSLNDMRRCVNKMFGGAHETPMRQHTAKIAVA